MILTIVLLWFGTIWTFVAVMHAKARIADVNLFWKVHLFPLAAIGIVMDCAFNLLFGSVMFMELPHELLFSSRVQRHFRAGPGVMEIGLDRRRFMLAAFWARQLNLMDPGHIKL